MSPQPDVDDPVFRRILGERRPHETDAEFARRMGISPPAYSEWKRGKSRPADRETLIKVADGLDVSLDYLLTGTEHDETRPDRASIVHQLHRVIRWIQGEAVDWKPVEEREFRDEPTERDEGEGEGPSDGAASADAG